MVTTKHGNRYTEKEWADMMENWAQEIADSEEYEDGIEAILKAGKAMLIEAGIDSSKAYAVAHRIFTGGEITFTSVEKEAAASEIARWMAQQERRM